jgi:5'(3')-deoxyribonucleotidase
MTSQTKKTGDWYSWEHSSFASFSQRFDPAILHQLEIVMSTIYLDMDGVVADFDAYASEILGERSTPYTRYPEEKWNKLLQNQRFYRDLPLCKDARLLVTSVLQLAHQHNMEVLFLSALPKNNDFPWAAYDKVLWAQKYFPMIPVWLGPYSNDKQLRSKPGDVLIDDREININQWNSKGGFGILYRDDTDATIKELKDFLHR